MSDFLTRPATMAAAVLTLAWLIDAFLGEPPTRLHPVVWMGYAIRPLLWLRGRGSAPLQFVAGLLHSVLLASLVGLGCIGLERALSAAPVLALCVQAYLVTSLFALRALARAGEALADAVDRGDLRHARERLGHLCSRDPSQLDAHQLCAAGMESLAENTHDSVVAPLFYYLLGGLPALAFYRVFNTLDAMVGYRDDREFLGKAPARIDDVLNFVPARVSTLLLWLAARSLGHRAAPGWLADAQRTESPNAGWPMALVSATVGVRLDKPGGYVIGEGRPPATAAALRESARLVRRAGHGCALLCIALLAWHGGPLIGSFESREHGDQIVREAPGAVVDFSVNLNPYGPCERVLAAARAADLGAYPESTALHAREAWARQLGCDPDELLLAHGAADLLWHVAGALLLPGTRCGLLSPTFSEAEAAARAAGAEVVSLRASGDSGFTHDLGAASDALQRCQLAYLCSPNNPTGSYLDGAWIDALAERCPDTTIVVDQSFLALSDHADDLHRAPPENVIQVRSLTKEHTLAGLRVGLARCRPSLARALETRRASWPTSAPVQAAAAQAAVEMPFVQASWQRMRRDRDELRHTLVKLGLAPLPSHTSFQLVPVPDARDLTRRLLIKHAVAVRDASSFGLPDHIRVAARPAADREVLRNALAQELS